MITRQDERGRWWELHNHTWRLLWTGDMLSYLRRHYPCSCDHETADILQVSVTLLRRKVRELGLHKDPEWLKKTTMDNCSIMRAVSASHPNVMKTRAKPGQHLSPRTEFKPGHGLKMTPDKLAWLQEHMHEGTHASRAKHLGVSLATEHVYYSTINNIKQHINGKD